MMMEARDDRSRLEFWRNCGGDAALMSYAPLGAEDGRLADVPGEHWAFLDERCVDLYEIDTHFFVHGGVRPNLPLDGQTPLVLRWQTFDDPPPHVSGKIMVCGHTPQPGGGPRDLGHAVCIDTHAHADGGWLTCLDVRSGDVWQANERGEVRRFHLRPRRAQ
jgi:serine/threonine protein phosphatase 1